MTHETFGFIGLGLIGGSLAKALKRSNPSCRIMSYSRNSATTDLAISEHAIDICCTSVSDPQFAACDCIFLCAPVDTNISALRILKDIVPPDCILTDVGSVKTDIHRAAQEMGLNGRFIGGHPMVGSEKTGLANATAYLLENAYYIITPGAGVAASKADDFRDFIASLGAIPLVLACDRHDHATAAISHLPHVVAAALVNLVRSADDSERIMKRIAAGGFRDITRIASSSPVMWQQICMENHENISNVLDDYIRMLIQIRCSVDNCASDDREADAIYQMFASSRDYRDSIDVVDNGPIRKAYVLYLDIADEAGGIATIATILAMDKISIKNIGIIHNREFEQGVLKVEFYDQDSMDRGLALLKKRNYIVYER